MKKILRTLPLILLSIALLAGCGTLYTLAVTVSDAEDAVMNTWATLHNNHQTTPALDQKVMDAHDKFNKAKLIAATNLRAYKAGGDKNAYELALETARLAIDPIIDLIAPLLTKEKTVNLRSQAASANGL